MSDVAIRPAWVRPGDVADARADLIARGPALAAALAARLDQGGLVHPGVLRLPRTSEGVWIVGDLHGDLLALEAALAHVYSSAEGTPDILFLGDLIDDGEDSHAVLLRVIELLLGGPGKARVTLIAGNHDAALEAAADGFSSSVDPSTYASWLAGATPAAVEVARLAVRLVARSPRAVLFEDGLLAAHGGFPHTDLLPDLGSADALGDPRCLVDFCWLRAAERGRRDPNRLTRGCQFGPADFAAFRRAAAAAGVPVERLVRGHDHFDERFRFHSQYEGRALTVNTLSHRLERELPNECGYTRLPAIARGRAGALPSVTRLFVSPATIETVYPEPAP